MTTAIESRSQLEVEWRDYWQAQWAGSELRVPGSGLIHQNSAREVLDSSASPNPELGTRSLRGGDGTSNAERPTFNVERSSDSPAFLGRRFTVRMLAEQYELTDAEARKLIRAELPHLKFGRELVVREGDVLVWEAKRLKLPEVMRSGNGYTLDLQIQMACALDLLLAAGRIRVNWRAA